MAPNLTTPPLPRRYPPPPPATTMPAVSLADELNLRLTSRRQWRGYSEDQELADLASSSPLMSSDKLLLLN
uniref:Uncharacterized protein n=1 Tax=Oryza punctata TaxID=4537 RepID=A0A0E0KY28_ORYPU